MAPSVSCSCGSCAKCKQRAYMRDWYARQSARKKRAISERVYAAAKSAGRANKPASSKRAARSAAAGTPMARCSSCGSTKNLQRHHPNHSQPKRVRVLCATCHGRTQRG